VAGRARINSRDRSSSTLERSRPSGAATAPAWAGGNCRASGAGLAAHLKRGLAEVGSGALRVRKAGEGLADADAAVDDGAGAGTCLLLTVTVDRTGRQAERDGREAPAAAVVAAETTVDVHGLLEYARAPSGT
jgi:hypothetical protein